MHKTYLFVKVEKGQF